MQLQRKPADESSFAEMRQIVDDNQPLGNWRVKLGLDIVLYYEGGFRENADGILHFYNQAIEVIGDKVEYFLTDGEGTFKKVRKDTRKCSVLATSDAAPWPHGLDWKAAHRRTYRIRHFSVQPPEGKVGLRCGALEFLLRRRPVVRLRRTAL